MRTPKQFLAEDLSVEQLKTLLVDHGCINEPFRRSAALYTCTYIHMFTYQKETDKYRHADEEIHVH